MNKKLVIGVGIAALILLAVLFGRPVLELVKGQAESIATVAPSSAPAAGRVKSTASFGRPRAKKCLTPASIDLGGGDEMAAMRVGDGLDGAQISGAFKPYLSYLADCQPVDGDDHSGSVTFAISVGCNGLVASLEVADDSLYEPEMIACLEKRLEHVEFPAHDLEEGMYFEYPFIFHPPK